MSELESERYAPRPRVVRLAAHSATARHRDLPSSAKFEKHPVDPSIARCRTGYELKTIQRANHDRLRRVHVAGHSSGAVVATQLALDNPEIVHTLILLELSLFSVPSGEAFFQQAGPAFRAYERGDHEEALTIFMGVVSGLDWATCRALLDKRLPGAVTQAIKDADTFFGIELPALAQWTFGAEQAAAIPQPVLSVRGTRTQPMWVEVAAFLRTSLPHVQDCTIDGVGHLHIQRPEPVAQGIAQFLRRNPMAHA